MRRVVELLTALLIIPGLLAMTPVGAATTRYAGTVRAIDGGTGMLVLEDVGPWIGTAESPITARTIAVSRATEYVVADRTEDGVAPSGYLGDYVERRAQLADVTVGAFVSVECERDGERYTARKVVVVRPSQS